MVVDPDSVSRKAVSNVLESHGAIVSQCDSPNAIDFHTKDLAALDLLLWDAAFSDREAVDIVKRLDQREPGPRILIATTYGRSAATCKSMGASAASLIMKPLGHLRILRTAVEALNAPRKSVFNDPTQPKEEPEPSPPSSISVLLVEDNPINQKLAVLSMQKLGISPVVVDDGAAAIQSARNNDYDFILMDLLMPGVGGGEAARKILASFNGTKPDRQAPTIIALSANPVDDVRADCQAAGMSGFLPKPVRVKQLKQVILDRDFSF